MERIQENPAVASNCYLPLNASILLHLFKCSDNTLPTTQYGIFSELVLSCIYRHLNERTQHKNLSLESLDQLPEFLKKPFLDLCELAYQGVMEDRVIFSSESLPPNVNTLSLLQGVESFVRRGKGVSYNFIHLSVQEMLAAFYIARHLPASEQVLMFNELLGKSRLNAVFQFYAAITKLQTPGVSDVVTGIARRCVVKPQHVSDKDQTLLLSLLHCFYEAQAVSLCESVVHLLHYGLNLSFVTLTPSDCLCVGYFLSHVCKSTAGGEFKVNLTSCSIDELNCRYLVSGLHKYVDIQSTVRTTLNIDLGYSDIHEQGTCDLLQTYCVSSVRLIGGKLSDQGALIAQQVKNNSILRSLSMHVGCDFHRDDVASLTSALSTNPVLEILDLGCNALCDEGIQHLACALKLNHNLKLLKLVACGMTDMGLECLARSLQHNKSLEVLEIWNDLVILYENIITEKGASVLIECLKKNQSLLKLVLPADFKYTSCTMQEAVNEARMRRKLPLIKVTGGSSSYISTLTCRLSLPLRGRVIKYHASD